jgi:hypothetical protein
LKLDLQMVARSVAAVRKQREDRVLVTLSGLTYGYWHPELLDLQKADGHVEYLIDVRIPAGSVEVQNIQYDGREPAPQLFDCREKARRA